MIIDVSGRRFGRLLVLSRTAPSTTRREARWMCSCSCGGRVVVTGSRLRLGKTRSCGCLRREIARSVHTTHGHGSAARGQSPTYRSWASMIARCTMPSNGRNWKWYGGRGVTVCPDWRDSFEAFLCDMGPRPAGHSLDRVNSDGNYEPGNCRWATPIEQAANRKRRAV